MAADAGELKARATLDNTEFLSSLKDLVAQIQQNTEDAAKRLEGMSNAFGNIGKVVEGLGALEGVKRFIEDVSDAAVGVGKLEASLQALNGTTEETHNLFESIHDLSLNSMFSLEGVLGPAAQQMLKLGVSAQD